MKRLIAGILSIFLCAGLLGGCGGEKEPHTPTGDGLTWDEDYTGPVYTRPPSEELDELTLTYDPKVSMNPLLSGDFTNRTLFSLIYQSLFIVDRDYKVEPLLCKSFTVSQDMKSYTFYPEAAKFSDGSVLTAGDVMATLLAAKESDVYSGRFHHVTEILLSNDGGIRVNLDTPYEDLPVLLDIPILKSSQLQSPRPLGTGPYVLDTTGEIALLRKNTDWWCSATLPVSVGAIRLTEAGTAAEVRDEFEFEDLDLVCTDPGSDHYADYRCDYELWDCQNNIFLYLACNMDSRVFSIPEIRQMLPLAVDRVGLADKYYRGFAQAAALPAVPGSPYYSQVLAERYAYDGGKALTQAVAQAQLAPDITISLLVNSDDSLRLRVARDIRDMLQSCGLTVIMKEEATSSYMRTLELRDYDLYLGQTKLSANMDLSAFFSSGGGLRYGNFNSVSLYTLCTEALANHGNYYTLHQTLMNDGRLCPILFRSYAVYATRGLLTDLTPARDNIFYYSLGKTMEKAQKVQTVATETTPETTLAEG